MLRFLDKRFYHRKKLKFDLFAFCYDKLGLSRSYTDVAQLKRRLNPAIKELEERKFLKPIPTAQRYIKVTRGKWDIIFEAYRCDPQQTLAIEVDDLTDLEACLVKHGISRVKAARFAAELPEERILQDVELLEFNIAKGNPPKDSGPWLTAALTAKEAYLPPADFKSSAQKAQEAQDEANKAKAKEAAKKQRKAAQKRAEEQERQNAAQESAMVGGISGGVERQRASAHRTGSTQTV